MRTRTIATLAGLAALAACAMTEGGWDEGGVFAPTPADGVQGDAAPGDGEALYAELCGACHFPAGMGTGLLARRYEGELTLLTNRDDLTPEFIELVAREGVGNMPRLSRAEVSDALLAAIAAYLTEEREP
jgi:mono/diheme cytochrome c family protein